MRTLPRLIVIAFAFLFASVSFADGDSMIEAFVRREMEKSSICLVKGHVAEGELVLRLGSNQIGVVKSVEGKERAVVQYAPFDSAKSQFSEKQEHLAKTVKTNTGLAVGDSVEVYGFNTAGKISQLFEEGHAIFVTNGLNYLIKTDDVAKVHGRAYTRGISAKSVALYSGWTGYYAVDVLSVDPVAKTAVVSYVANDGADPFTAKLSSLYPRAQGARSGITAGDFVGGGDRERIGRVHFIFDNGVMKIHNESSETYLDRKIWEVQKVD